METFKARADFFEPDPRNAGFAKLDVQTGKAVSMTLDDHYEMVKHFRLHDGVPEDVRSYWATIATLWLYGWLYYPFCTLTQFLSATAVEMALRLRFPINSGKDRRGLHDLLRQAKDGGFLREDAFPSFKARRENSAELERQISEASEVPHTELPQIPYAEILIAYLPKIRNNFAHPEMHAIMFPGQAIDLLILASETISQLWPDPHPHPQDAM